MQVIWRNEWIHEYETPWSIFEKFTLTNRVERNSLMRYLGNNDVKSIKNNLIGEKRRELFELSGFSKNLINEMFGYNLVDFNEKTIDMITKPLSNLNFPKQYWFFKHLRWCENCISNGHHSWFHQFILLNHCPYHSSELFDKCPVCKNEIPFTYSSKALAAPFTCKCGYKLTDFDDTLWGTWNIKLKIINKPTIDWLSDEIDPRKYNFYFTPQMCHLDLLTQSSIPSATHHFKNTTNDLITLNDFNDYCYSNSFTREMYTRNVEIYYTVNRYLTKKYLTDHHKCVKQFVQLLKEDNKEFPPICPIAYAYVNWRKYLLEKDHFYNISTRSNDATLNGGSSGFEMMTSAIQSQVKELLQSIIRQNKEKRISKSILLWIHDQWFARFSILFFCNCLKYSESKLKQQSNIKWIEVLELTKLEFKIAFKLVESKTKIIVNVLYKKQNSADSDFKKYKCPYDTLQKKRAISKMNPYSPMRIALNWPVNKDLKEYVDSFVKKYDR